ncbi:MAG: SCO family protein [Pelovirga sp.]
MRSVLLFLVALVLLPGTLMAEPERVDLVERLGEKIPLDLEFVDATGATVQLGQLIDRPTLVVPVFYNCRSVCNMLLGGLSATLPKVRLTPGEDYQVLTFSFDPEETPQMAAHSKRTFLTATQSDFPAAAWHFLTGDAAAIKRLTEAAGYYYFKENDEFIHPTATFVVAADGTIVRYLIGQSIPPIDLSMALFEASEGRIGKPIRKALEYCFTYDPESRRYVFNLMRVSGTVILLTLGSFFLFLILSGRKKKP